jgi:GNAT superfamily N-acetyltransferase
VAPPVVRPCQSQDAGAIAALLRELSETAARVRRFLSDCRAAPGVYSNYLAELDGRAAGFLSAVFYETPFHAKGTCLINELVVARGARGRGVGRGLVETVREEARRRGFDEEYVLLGQEFEQ